MKPSGANCQMFELCEKKHCRKKTALIKKKKKTANVCPLWWRFYQCVRVVFTCFCTKWPLASSFLRRCEKILKGEFDKIIGPSEKEGFEVRVCQGLGISKPTVFEIPWFLGQLRFFWHFIAGIPPCGKVPFGRDARNMTCITHRFYGFVSKRHGLLVHFGCKLGLPKNKNLRHSMRCFFNIHSS